jgi:hypothetical protein
MVDRPMALPVKVWAKLDDKQKAYVSTAWDGMKDGDKNDIIEEKVLQDAIDMLLVDMPSGNGHGKTETGDQAPADLTAMTPDVADYIKSVAAKVTDEMKKDMSDSIEMKIEADFRRIKLFIDMDAIGLDLPAPDSKPDVTANSPARKLGDIYYVPRTSKKGKPLDDAKRHRLHDIFDVVFGADYVAKVNSFAQMNADAIGDIGEEKYDEDYALAKKRLAIGRKYFTEAAGALVAFRAINDLPGVRVRTYKDPKGNVSRSPVPFQLAEMKVGPDGKLTEIGRTQAISLTDLEAYQPEKAKERFDKKESPTMYDAVRASKPPKKKRVPNAGTGTRGATSAQGNDVVIRNVEQYESASAETAAYVETPGFKADWLKRINDPDGGEDFLLSEVAHFKFLDKMLGMNGGELLKKAGTILDARADKPQAAAA